MDTEEKYIFERCGKGNPFRVPEGYFDGLTDQILTKVATVEKEVASDAEPQPVTLHVVARKTIFRRWIAAASVAGIAVLTSTIWFSQSRKATQKTATPVVAVSQSSSNDAYFDQLANYTAMDNDDIYNYCVEQN